MTSYFCDEKSYVLLHVTSLLFDERVADMVEENKSTFPTSLSRSIYDAGAFKLSRERLERVMSGYHSGLPPIKVMKTLNGMYKVIDGRHRVCAVIIKEDTSVPCVVVKEN